MGKSKNDKGYTSHELAAMQLVADKCDESPEKWIPLRAVDRGVWYDWADPKTGMVGQCRMGETWRWTQEPKGVSPVILRLKTSKDRG